MLSTLDGRTLKRRPIWLWGKLDTIDHKMCDESRSKRTIPLSEVSVVTLSQSFAARSVSGSFCTCPSYCILLSPTPLNVSALEKTKREEYPDLAQQQQDRLREIQQQQKQEYKRLAKEKAEVKRKAMEEKEARSYDRIMKEENMTKTTDRMATEDATAAEEYEDDFF